MQNKRLPLWIALGAMAIAPIASAQVVQTPLAGSALPQFVDPLPLLDLTASGTLGIDTAVAGPDEIELHMREFKANVMPTGFVPANGLPYAGTSVFGYIRGPAVPGGMRASYLGPVIVTTRDVPTQIRFVNDLGVADPTFTNPLASKVYAFVNSTDQTLHWADPLGMEMNMCNHMIVPMMPPMPPCDQHYAGPIPAVPHLHGGYVPPGSPATEPTRGTVITPTPACRPRATSASTVIPTTRRRR
jgi:spore coat protein A